MIGDLNEKQNLLLEASKALDLLDKQKNEELKRAQVVIDELHQKVESLEHEVNSLQNALSEANKNSMANDTGYADFIGAVDPREIECQKKLQEIREIEENFTHQMTVMNEKMIELQAQKKEIEMQASNLLYENDEMKDKMAQVAKQFSDQVRFLDILGIVTYRTHNLLCPHHPASTRNTKPSEIFAMKDSSPWS